MTIPKQSTILPAWATVRELQPKRATLLSVRLRRDLPQGHVRGGLQVTAVATRQDRDDVL